MGSGATSATAAGGPEVSVKVCWLDEMPPSAAPITVDPTVVPEILTAHVPLEPVRQDDALNMTGVPLAPKSTRSLDSGLREASVTFAVAVVEEEPFATMLVGFSDSVTLAAGPGVSVKGTELDVFVTSLAVIVEDPTAVLVMLTLQAPVGSVVHCVGLNETGWPVAVKLTTSLGTATPARVTDTEATLGVAPSSGMLD